MTVLTAKQIRRMCVHACVRAGVHVCVSVLRQKMRERWKKKERETETEREREKVQADVCIHSVGGSRLFAEDRETREGKEKKKDGERQRG